MRAFTTQEISDLLELKGDISKLLPEIKKVHVPSDLTLGSYVVIIEAERRKDTPFNKADNIHFKKIEVTGFERYDDKMIMTGPFEYSRYQREADGQFKLQSASSGIIHPPLKGCTHPEDRGAIVPSPYGDRLVFLCNSSF